MKSSVYWIRHPDHTDMFTQGYVGVSSNLTKRWDRHAKRTQNAHLANAIKKYGWDNLVKKVVLIADEAYCLAMETKVRAVENIGWNITKGGGKPPAKANSGSFKLGLTPFNKGLKMDTPAWNKGLKMENPSWNKGIICSEETKQKISLSNLGMVAWNKGLKNVQVAWNKGTKGLMPSTRKGVILSQAIRDKISASKMGEKRTLEQREAMSKARLGRKHSIIVCPHCQKSGGSTAMPRWHFDNCKLKDNLL